jgi:asparagine synthase (glutamine-hydrolysing)
MCGIAGYIGRQQLFQERIEECQHLMRRRGPNSEGLFRHVTPEGLNLVLLHSRLSILDLDPRSNQPFSVDGNRLIFNGEIYNYKELRAELSSTGWVSHGTGDTEVLAKLLAERGVDGLRQCEGMWGIAWYSKTSGELLLARDRFGEKPLYTYKSPDGSLYFGSEVKFIFAMLGFKLPINYRHLKRYLVNGYKSLYKTRETFYDGLTELPPGYLGRFTSDGSYLEEPYWVPDYRSSEVHDMSYAKAVEGTRERLIRSVELRLRADVPVAFCLSGGIDSNALIAIAKRELGFDVHGYTIMNQDTRYEERDMVELAVKELALKHTPIKNDTKNFLPQLRELIRYHDAPVYTITYYAQWRLLKEIAKDGFKVSISGTGADELFSGYYDHHNAYLSAIFYNHPDKFNTALEYWDAIQKPIVRNPFLKNPYYFIQKPNSREHIYLDSEIFSEYLVHPFQESFTELCLGNTLLRNRMANELLAESVPVILHEDDLNAMYFSVENRSPFLDTKLFEWSLQIPTEHLIHKGVAKAVLRDAVRGLVPDRILDNPRKVGFNAPILDYLDLNDRNVVSFLLSDSPIYKYVKKDSIKTLLEEKVLANSASKFLFNFINAKIFLEEYER